MVKGAVRRTRGGAGELIISGLEASGPLGTSVDLAGLDDLIDGEAYHHRFEPKHALDFQQDYLRGLSNNDPISKSMSYTYSPASLGPSNSRQQTRAQRPLSNLQPIQPTPAHVSSDTVVPPKSGSPSSSMTQSPVEYATRSSSLRRKRPQSDSSDQVDAAADKRRRNTLAARRFRQRQQDRIAQLERALEEVGRERDDLKVRVAKCEGEVTALRGMLGKKSRM
ncbi:predicted protein [Uncinocarpus reesii 1704]|uniref:BZIP domain-containing protein n=1 Tax=Uncinocarpus reesii (strain UAMH 1704) TaxID=336963 RepID=C4JVH4_UNCRE|nr:uncharacterized protein UREG_06566 [Uncinocarpus reesii 1704]EEP81701.1 predicted protein [Uncinocarpus reesii 1704]